MFCRGFQAVLPKIDDPELRKDVQAFIRQEAAHARAHDNAAQSLLTRNGIDSTAITQFVDWLVREGPLADPPFGVTVPQALHPRWERFATGVVASIEHITCFMGSYLLQNESWEAAGADSAMVALLKWHGAEEIEHRCVAYDVHATLGGGSTSERITQVVFGLPFLLALTLAGSDVILKQDPVLGERKLRPWKPAFWREWRRAARVGHLPSISWLAKEQLRYLHPRYHPIHEGCAETAMAYLEGSEQQQWMNA